jgi:hypothetical protein
VWHDRIQRLKRAVIQLQRKKISTIPEQGSKIVIYLHG